jgi:thioredoxin reductase (NADPH)
VQGTQFGPEVVLDEEIHTFERDAGPGGDLILLHGKHDTYPTKTVVVAGGKGAFEPQALEVPGYEELLGHGVHYAVKDPEVYRGKKVVIIGGGDSALDWTLILKEKQAHVVLAHRRDRFRAHEVSVERVMEAGRDGALELRLFHEVAEIHGNGQVEAATLFDNRTDERVTIECDAVLTFLGFKPDLGPIETWGLELKANRIVVNQLMETNLPGVYAAGDVVDYPGKLDLIASGFAEAAIAVNNAVHRVDPSARVNPGHSTSMKVFKQK